MTQTDGNGDVTLDSFDPMQRLVAETNPISGTTVYTDNATAQTAVRDPMGNPTSYQYDAAGRLITQTAPLTGSTLYQYDPAGNTTAITTQDANTGTPIQVEQQGYDSLDRVLTDTISGPSQPPTTTLTRYDHNGNVFQVQQPNGDVVVNTYDFANQLTNTQLYMAPVSGPSGATGPSYDAYSYDQAGNVTDHYDADGRHTTTAYDGDNRIAQTVDTTSTGTITTTPQYDPDSNVLTQTMQTVDLTQPGVQQTHTLTNTYNAADWLMSTGDDGLVSSYQYDAAGQPRSETIQGGQTPVTAVLDPEGRATAIGENLGGTGPYSSTFSYNQDDLPLTVTLHSDTPSAQVQQSAQYDANIELTHLTATGPTGVSNPLSSAYDYAYNAAGWTTAMTWTVNGAVTATQIGHNALGRITSWTGQIHGPETWAYDGNGNIISNTEFISDAIRTTTFTYSQTTPNQLDQQQTQGLGVEYFTYDQHGDTTSLTSTDPATYPNGQLDPYHVNIHVGYDAEERPLTITTLMDGAPITATLAYNAAGLRSRYTVISGTTTLRDEHFQYRDGLLGQDIVISGTQTYTDTFIYNPGGLPLELIRQQGGTTSRYWYVLDGRGNVVGLTDVNGNVVDRYSYDPWGEGLPEGTSETVRQPLRYGGYWWDQEVGWYWVTTRYYDPEGRWLQPDASEIDGLHTYVYVGDDPIDLSDPLGLGVCSGSNGFLSWIGNTGCNIGNFLGDVAQGAGSAAYESAQGTYNLITSVPGAVVRSSVFEWFADRGAFNRQWQANRDFASFLVHNPQTIVLAFVAPYQSAISSGHPGQAVGRGAYELVLFFIGPKALSKLGELTAVGEAASGAGSAANAANAARLAKQLLQEEAASRFTASGSLSREFLSTRHLLIEGSRLNNPAVLRELLRAGGDIADWGKYETETIRTPSGDYRVHFYYNPKTDTAVYTIDYKSVRVGVQR